MEKTKLLITTLAAAGAVMTASAHHHGGFWGRGGRHFWPGFAGGVVGGIVGGYWHRPVVYTTPVYTTPVYTTPTVVTQPQPTVVTVPATTPAPAQTQQVQAPEVQVVQSEADRNAVEYQREMTTVYIDTNGCKWVEGKMKVDAKGNTLLPDTYLIKHINDVKELQR